MPTARRSDIPARYNGGKLTFLREFLAQPRCVGSVLPSSRRLAHALMAPFMGRSGPARLLEVGAGTGAVTHLLGYEIGPKDELSICEVQPALADHVEREVLSRPQFVDAVREGRVRMARCAIQDMPLTSRFDYIISGLPFTAFAEEEVRNILEVVRSAIKPGGVFSYFEYVGLRRLRRFASFGQERQRLRRVSSILDSHIGRFQIGRKTVLANFPPAHARYWRFD